MLTEYPENRYEKIAEVLEKPELKGLPLCVKGGAVLQKKTTVFLREIVGVNVDYILIDREYHDENLRDIDGIPVRIFEDYLLTNACILVIAHKWYDYEKIPFNLRSNIKYIFDYDFIGRFPIFGLYDKPITAQYLQERKSDVEWIYDKLSDEKSEKALDEYLYQRIYGNYSKPYDTNQYFPEDVILFGEDEVFLDVGAFQGDTITAFIHELYNKGIKQWNRIIAFEPDPVNIEIMKSNLLNVSDIEYVQAGAYSKSTILYFNSGNGANSSIADDGDISIEVIAIDDVLHGDEATFIKMDIEGSEMEALIGARNTITKYKPKLAICIYHKREDFIDIPKYIYSLRSDYKFYIRNHDSSGGETVLYAV